MRLPISLALFLLTTFTVTDAAAQLLMRKHARKHEAPPKAILVQLPTYERRIAYFEKNNNKASLEILKRDADSMAKKMVADFTDNFNYCPVYFFYDNNIEKVKTRKFENVLLDNQLQQVSITVLSATDSNYVIATFGNVVHSGNGGDEHALASSKHRLQIFDHQYRIVKKPLPDGTNNVWGGKFKKDPESYKYESPKFDIYYTPYVAHYNGKLHVFYGKYPY